MKGPVKLFEQFINEAARVGSSSSWKQVLKDLSRHVGWKIVGNTAVSDTAPTDERGTYLVMKYEGDGEISYTIYDENDEEIISGAFDGSGLSASELEDEVWYQADITT
jgi:hypothetical protein